MRRLKNREQGMPIQEITLPWPASVLSPNSRAHWAQKARARKKQRMDCFMLAKTAGRTCLFGQKINIALIFCPPDKRRRDMDNLLSSMKGGLDGLADAWGVDDNRFVLTIQRGPVVKRGAVMVQFGGAG